MDDARMLPHDWFPEPLPPNVIIGARSCLYSSFAFLHYRSQRPCGVRIGHDSGVYHGTTFELETEGEVEIGDYCTVVGAIFCSNSRMIVRNYVFIAHQVVIADSFAAVPPGIPGSHDARQASSSPGPSIVIGENAWIGMRAVLLSGAQIGEGAIIGAGAVVDFEVPDYAVIAGSPARIVGWAKPGTGAQQRGSSR
jgi:acetyltransferase-like isoleucine patch superfamily enzyme